MRIRFALVLAVSGSLLLAAESAQASITVANQNDSGPGSLRQAIAGAAPGETIVVPAGTYSLTSEELTIEKNLTISGHSAADTTIRAAGKFRVIRIGGPVVVKIADVTIRDGHPTGPTVQGGGINAGQSDLTLQGVDLTHNAADASGASGVTGGTVQGGGVYSTETLTLIDTTVAENVADARGGNGKSGGTTQGGGVFEVGSVRISDSSVSDNRATAVGGQGPATPSQNGGTAQGGGLFVVDNHSQPAEISASTFSGNVADVSGGPGGSGSIGQGGGVFAVINAGSASFANTTVAANFIQGGPGGITQGGGIFVGGDTKSGASFLSTTTSGNGVRGAPGISQGGDLFSGGVVSFANSIVADGSGAAEEKSQNCFPSTETISVGFNLDSLDQCQFHSTGDKVNTNPLLGPLQDNGGPAKTLAPAGNSPAVDQGAALGLATDERGVVRPIDFPSIPNAPGGDGSDIGAYELQPSNAFTIGTLKKIKKKGTASLSIGLPQPSAGTLQLKGKGLKPQSVAIAGQATVQLKISTKGGAAKALRKQGKRKVKLEVTYAPTANQATSQARTVKLVRSHRKPKKNR